MHSPDNQLSINCKKCGKSTINGGDGLCVPCRTRAMACSIVGLAPLESLPELNRLEHTCVEAILGRTLTNEEAHAALRELRLEDAATDYINRRIQ